MKSCAEIQSELSAYLDRELPEVQRLELSEHLGRCARCRAQEREFLQLKELLRAHPLPSLPPEWAVEIRNQTVLAPSHWTTPSLRRWLPAAAALIVFAGAGLGVRTFLAARHRSVEMARPVAPPPDWNRNAVALHPSEGEPEASVIR